MSKTISAHNRKKQEKFILTNLSYVKFSFFSSVIWQLRIRNLKLFLIWTLNFSSSSIRFRIAVFSAAKYQEFSAFSVNLFFKQLKTTFFHSFPHVLCFSLFRPHVFPVFSFFLIYSRNDLIILNFFLNKFLFYVSSSFLFVSSVSQTT